MRPIYNYKDYLYSMIKFLMFGRLYGSHKLSVYISKSLIIKELIIKGPKKQFTKNVIIISTEAQINRYFTAKGNPGRKPRTTFSSKSFCAQKLLLENQFYLTHCRDAMLRVSGFLSAPLSVSGFL